MVTLDLVDPAAPTLLHTFNGYAAAHDLVIATGLRATDTLLDRGENEEGRRIYGATLQKLDPPQQSVVQRAADERRDFEAAHGRRPGPDDADWLAKAWQRAAQQLPASGADEASETEPRLDALFAAVLCDPRVRAPAPTPRAAPAVRAPAASKATGGKAPAATATATAATAATAATPAPGSLDLAGVTGLLTRLFPPELPGPDAALSTLIFIKAALTPDSKGRPSVIATFQLMISDRLPSGETMVRDIKEQDVTLCEVAQLASAPRLVAYLEALRQALDVLFAGDRQKIETLLPSDLVITDVLALKKAVTVDDMRKALLVKSRLGRHLA